MKKISFHSSALHSAFSKEFSLTMSYKKSRLLNCNKLADKPVGTVRLDALLWRQSTSNLKLNLDTWISIFGFLHLIVTSKTWGEILFLTATIGYLYTFITSKAGSHGINLWVFQFDFSLVLCSCLRTFRDQIPIALNLLQIKGVDLH